MNRRDLISCAALAGTPLLATAAGDALAQNRPSAGFAASRSAVVTRDGTRLFVRDWGSGRPILFASAWCFNSDAWGFHVAKLAGAGFRCVAYDRRGHGKSDDPGRGYDADTLADDLAAVIDGLGLDDVTIVAYSMGSIEAVRYATRYGLRRVARLILVAPVTPYLTKSPDNPTGVPATLLAQARSAIASDFPKWLSDNEAPFFTPDTSSETRNWVRGMMQAVALPTVLACHETFAGTDFREDLRAIDRPVMIIHGDKDASAPLPITGMPTHQLVARSKLAVYNGAPHALPLTHKERLVADILTQVS